MAIKKKDWAEILRGLAQAVQIPYQIQQIKEAQKRQELEDVLLQGRVTKLQEENRQADINNRTSANALYSRRTGSTGNIGNVFPEAGLPPKLTASQTARQTLENARSKFNVPSQPASSAPTYRSDLFEAAEKDPAVLLQAFANIPHFVSAWNAYQEGKKPSGKTPTAEDIQKSQARWDEDVRNYVKVESNNLPKMRELLQERQGVIFLREKPDYWSDDDWQKYLTERLSVTNIFGVRPELSGAANKVQGVGSPPKGDSRLEKARKKGWIAE